MKKFEITTPVVLQTVLVFVSYFLRNFTFVICEKNYNKTHANNTYAARRDTVTRPQQQVGQMDPASSGSSHLKLYKSEQHNSNKSMWQVEASSRTCRAEQHINAEVGVVRSHRS